MRKLVAHLYTGTAGTDDVQPFIVEDDMSNERIEQIVYEMAVAHAEMYGIYPLEYMNEDTDEDGDSYSDDIDGTWEEYDAEKHDMLRAGGGSFEQDFEWLLGENG